MSLPNIKLTSAAKAEGSPLKFPPAPATDGGKARLPSSKSSAEDERSALNSTRAERIEEWIYDLSSDEEEEAGHGDSTSKNHSGDSIISRGRRRVRDARPVQPQGGHLRVLAETRPQQGGRARGVPIFLIGPDSSSDSKGEASTDNGSGQDGEGKEDWNYDTLSNLSLD